jgi:hypothetical protein
MKEDVWLNELFSFLGSKYGTNGTYLRYKKIQSMVIRVTNKRRFS